MGSKHETLAKNYFLLSLFLRNQVIECYKRMARDEDLFRFLSSQVDPVRIVDYQLQFDKTCLDLALKSKEQGLGVSALESGIEEYAKKLSESFLELYKDVIEGTGELLTAQKELMTKTVQFYRQWLSAEEAHENIVVLAQKSFESAGQFGVLLKTVAEASKKRGDVILKNTKSLHRFLMQKQVELELQHSAEVWSEFMELSFQAPKSLP